MTLWSSQGDYKVLLRQPADKDGGAIIAQLSQMNVPYQHAEGGGAILVPADKVHDVRLKLASPACPRARSVGFELMDSAPLRPDPVPGAPELPARPRRRTDPLDQLAGRGAGRARAPGAAATRTASSASSRSPRASVLLTLHPGRTLDRAQIAGIVHLVSSQRARAEPQGGQRARRRPARCCPAAPTAARRRAWTRSSCSTCSRSRPATPSACSTAGAGGRPRQPARQRHRRRRLLADRSHRRGVQAQPGRRRQRRGAQPADAARAGSAGAAAPSGVPGAASNQPPAPATAPITGAAAAAAGGPGRRRRRQQRAATPSPTTRSTRPCA